MSRDGLRLSVTLLSILPESIVPAAHPPEPRPGPDQADLPHPAWVARSAGPADGFDERGGPPWAAAEPPASAPRAGLSSPLAGPSQQSAAEAMLWAPVVGLVLGAIAAAVLYVFGQLLHTGSLVAAVLAVGSLAVLSRGLHLDGLADLADGLGSRRPAAGALEIMKQSDIGPFGVVALVLTLLIQVAALDRAQALGRGEIAIVAAAVTARLAMTATCRPGVPAARGSGLGALVAGSVRPADRSLAVRYSADSERVSGKSWIDGSQSFGAEYGPGSSAPDSVDRLTRRTVRRAETSESR